MAKPEWAGRLRSFRENTLRLSGAALGKKLGVTAMAISHKEAGRHPVTSGEWLQLGLMAADAGAIEDWWYFWEQAGLPKDEVMRIIEVEPAQVALAAGQALRFRPKSGAGRVGSLRVLPEVIEQMHTALNVIFDHAPDATITKTIEFLTNTAGKWMKLGKRRG